MTEGSVNFVNAIVAERQAQREAASSRRRGLRAVSRDQLNEARQHGLRARHAARADPLRATESQDPAFPDHSDTTTNGGIS